MHFFLALYGLIVAVCGVCLCLLMPSGSCLQAVYTCIKNLQYEKNEIQFDKNFVSPLNSA